jgi:hypothetical protein
LARTAALARIDCSACSLESPYGFVGRCGVSSVIGKVVGSPKVAHDEEKIRLPTAAASIACRSCSVPTVMF